MSAAAAVESLVCICGHGRVLHVSETFTINGRLMLEGNLCEVEDCRCRSFRPEPLPDSLWGHEPELGGEG